MNTGAKTPFKIIYEDNHLLVVIKPHGLVTQSDEYHSVALDTLMKEFVKNRDRKPGQVFLTPIHRLDKPAMGIVIFAKTSKALERMHQLMQDRKIDKTYIACLEKAPPFDQGHLSHFLKHGLHIAEIVKEKEGKKAELDFKILEKSKDRTWVEIKLHTGRYHQIRAQFAAIGCPILGDKRYGSHRILKDEAIALFHVKTSFLHPVKQTLLELGDLDVHARLDAFLDNL
jgi:23S rRNA pseudouridine1911/1915/1917 synthase